MVNLGSRQEKPSAGLPFSPRAEEKCVRGPSGRDEAQAVRAGNKAFKIFLRIGAITVHRPSDIPFKSDPGRRQWFSRNTRNESRLFCLHSAARRRPLPVAAPSSCGFRRLRSKPPRPRPAPRSQVARRDSARLRRRAARQARGRAARSGKGAHGLRPWCPGSWQAARRALRSRRRKRRCLSSRRRAPAPRRRLGEFPAAQEPVVVLCRPRPVRRKPRSRSCF